MYSQRFRSIARVLALASAVSWLPGTLAAQVAASQGKGNPDAPAPRWDAFAGYSILDPRGTFYPIQPDGLPQPYSFKLQKAGIVEDFTHYFNHNVGIVFEAGEHDLFINTGFASTGSSNSGILTLQSGLKYRWPGVHLTPFVHGLAGGADVDGPDHEPYTWGPVVTAGGGLDWYFGCHPIGIRLFEADYEFLHANSGVSHGTIAGDNFTWADDENINAIRVAAGVVFRGSSYYSSVVGCGPMPAPALACVATPAVIFPGDPVTVTATASGLNPKQTSSFTWTGPGISGTGNVVDVPTAHLAPGTYTVRARVTEGVKNPQSADCEASFTVKPWLAPTCSIPMMTSIHSDQTGSFTVSGVSPQNLPLKYTCSSSAGSVAMTGNSGIFSPGDAPPGPVTIKCSVTDDKSNSAECVGTITIDQPPAIVNPHVVPLCSLDFASDDKRPTRVNNEAKACLDDVALSLQQHPDDNLLVVGEASASGESTEKAAQRAVNTKNYLTSEKGIDPARITVVTGNEGTKGVEEYLVPSGAVYTSDVQNTTPVDENAIKPQERKPLPVRSHPAHKKSSTPKTPPAPAAGSNGP